MTKQSIKPAKPIQAHIEPDVEQRLVSAQWQDPLPPPESLAAFGNVVDNGAERIIRMAEIEQSHRHSMDRAVVEFDAKSISRGQWLGFAVSFAAMSGAVVTAIAGVHWAIPVALVGVPLASVVKAFLSKK